MATFFTDFFEVEEDVLENYGAFNVSLITDLPLFIDPFLLFNSDKPEYQAQHDKIIEYLVFLRDKSADGNVSEDLLRAWYCFKEVKQNWFGFSKTFNGGSGLGIEFAHALNNNLGKIFGDFGEEKITHGSHLEKVCLIQRGVGRDNISDFTTNLIKDFLCEYTEGFANKYLRADQVKRVSVQKAVFNYNSETWQAKTYNLPWRAGDYIIITPKDILTRDETWINRGDLIRDFEAIPQAIDDAQLRAQVENHFSRQIASFRPYRSGKRWVRHPTQKDRDDAAANTLLQFPKLIDYFIKYKEENGEEAVSVSGDLVAETQAQLVLNIQKFCAVLAEATPFYQNFPSTYEEAHARLAYLKDVIENKGGHRYFYRSDGSGQPIQREEDLQIMYRLVWFGSPVSVAREVNDGRGPVDFQISRGAKDKTLVEMKLAKNSQLKRNLEKQIEIYKKASDAQRGIKVIIYFSLAEFKKVISILKDLRLDKSPDVVLIDARADNKPSGSKA